MYMRYRTLAVSDPGEPEAIVAADSDYQRTVAAGSAAVSILKDGIASGQLNLSGREQQWLERIENALGSLPAKEDDLRSEMLEQHGQVFDPASYGLPQCSSHN
jgi:hypothetical protein